MCVCVVHTNAIVHTIPHMISVTCKREYCAFLKAAKRSQGSKEGSVSY